MKKIFLLGAMLVATSLAVTSHAKEDGPCKTDRETLCKDVEHGDGRMMKCFKDNEDKLSAGCKAHMAEKKEKMKEMMKEISESCKGDVETHCAHIEKGKGRIMKCMKENKEKLSDACKAEIKEQRGKRK